MEVRRDWELLYDVDDVLRAQAADPAVIRARRPQLVALTQQALDEGRSLIDPAVLTHRLEVEGTRHNRVTLTGGATLTGPLINEHLGGAESVVVMLCTIGDRISDAARRVSAEHPGLAFALDAVGSAAILALSAAACNRVERAAIAAGLQTSLPLSPGLEGWGVDPGQREVFAIIDPALVGVTVSTSLEMQPLKSSTTVIGIGTDIAASGAICDYCDMRETCRHKIA